MFAHGTNYESSSIKRSLTGGKKYTMSPVTSLNSQSLSAENDYKCVFT